MSKTDAIYELIQDYKYKEALKLCNNKTLKTNNLALSLKAHCLAKLNKREEALELIDSLIGPNTDPSTLIDPDIVNVIEITYAYLTHHEGILKLCDAVVRTLKNNLVGPDANRRLIFLQEMSEKEFFAHLKLGNFEAMNKSSMAMYSQFKQIKYLYWAVSANMIRYKEATKGAAEDSPPLPPQINMLTMISERLSSKATTHELTTKDAVKPYPSCEEWKLYIDTLVSQSKYSEAISILENTVTTSDIEGNKKINDENDVVAAQGSLVQMLPIERDEMIAEFHSKNGDNESAESYYKKLITKYDLGKDQWDYYDKTLTTAKIAGGDFAARCLQLCDEMLQLEQDKLSFKLRAPRLLQIKIAASSGSGSGGDNNQLTSLIQSYVTIFYKKLCCFNDLKLYLHLVTETSQLIEFLQQMHTAPQTDPESDTYDDELRKFVISSQLLSYYNVEIDHPAIYATWTKSIRELKEGEQDIQRGDELIQLYAELKFNEAHSSGSSGGERIYKLIEVAAVLELAVEKSPYNYQFKLIALQVYDALASFGRGVELYNGLQVSERSECRNKDAQARLGTKSTSRTPL